MAFKTIHHLVEIYLCLIPGFLFTFILYPLSHLAVWWKNRILYKDSDKRYIPRPNLPYAVALVFARTRREYGGVYWLVLIAYICLLSALFSLPFVMLFESYRPEGMNFETICRYFFALSGLLTFILYPLSLIAVGRKNRTFPKDDDAPPFPYALTDDEAHFSPYMVTQVFVRNRKGFGGVYWLVLFTHMCMLVSFISIPFLK